MDSRYKRLVCWSSDIAGHPLALQSLAGDASFRCYYRVKVNGQNMIAMDAPPDRENNHAFAALSQTFRQFEVNVPEIYHCDFEQGFLLTEDFGDDLLFNKLNKNNYKTLYGKAIDQLLLIQRCQSIQQHTMGRFDKNFMAQELNLYRHWYLGEQLGVVLSDNDQQVLDQTLDQLVQAILVQPVVCVHRDFHSRNLMALGARGLGVLDFQDAIWGPVTYDLVSLLKDCYITWPRDIVEEMVGYYYEQVAMAGIVDLPNFDTFLQWFDVMGIQRHLKAIGIFSRLNQRDGKSAYLGDIPRTLNYLEDAISRMPQFQSLSGFLLPLGEHC